MHKCRCILQSLNHIRTNSIFQKCRHCAYCLNFFCRNRFSFISISNYNSSQTFFQIFHVVCKTKNRHDFGCYRDDEMIFSCHTIHLASESYRNITKYTVIHIDAAFPYDLFWINVKFISLLNMIIKHCRKKVICRSNRMKISREMKIQIIHRYNLCITAAGSTTF